PFEMKEVWPGAVVQREVTGIEGCRAPVLVDQAYVLELQAEQEFAFSGPRDLPARTQYVLRVRVHLRNADVLDLAATQQPAEGSIAGARAVELHELRADHVVPEGELLPGRHLFRGDCLP